MGITGTVDLCCQDCGRQLHTVWDYPANELWCLHCGNRYFAAMSAGSANTSDPLLGFRLLLLDEMESRRDSLARHFTQLGCLVTPVCHARQAMEAASFRRFDLVLMPASLTEFDWQSVVCKLRRLLGSLKIVVIEDAEPAERESANRSASDSCRVGQRPEAASDSSFGETDVICVQTPASDYHELEQMVEQVAEGIVVARQRRLGVTDEAEELLGIA